MFVSTTSLKVVDVPATKPKAVSVHPSIASSGSAPGYAHVAADGGAVDAAVGDEVVALRLSANRFRDGLLELLVAFREAQRRAQIGRVLLAKAHVELARAGEAHAVAALAEVMGHRRDEAELPARLLDPDVAGRPAAALRQILEREPALQPRPHYGEGQELIDAL